VQVLRVDPATEYRHRNAQSDSAFDIARRVRTSRKTGERNRRDNREAGANLSYLICLGRTLMQQNNLFAMTIKIDRRPVLSHWVTGFQPSRCN
jgi:hypothetical protein